MDHLIFILDEKRCILHMNDVAANRLGYTEGELLGKKLLEVHPPERREEANTILDEMVAGTASPCLIPIKTRDGQNIPVETRVKPGVWDGEKILFVITKDISEVKEADYFQFVLLVKKYVTIKVIGIRLRPILAITLTLISATVFALNVQKNCILF